MASSDLPVPPPKTILITCFGTRGDVQPFVNLGRYLQRHETMFRVSIVTHLEFEPLVREAGLGFEPLKRSLVRELQETEEGKRLKLAKPWNAMSLLKGFIRPIMLETYSDIKTAMDKTAPALVVFTTFPLMADCQALCRQHKPYPIPFVLCHTVPASPTREFAPTTAGVGRSLPFGFLNKFAWLAGEKMVGGMYIEIIRAAYSAHGIVEDELLTVPLSKRIRDSNLPVAYIYSRHVLPKPVDWTAEEMVVGPLFDELDLAPEMETAYALPADLRAYIDRAKVDKMPIVYIGLGSMLGTLFEDEQISKILNQIAEGAVQAQVKTPCRVIVHTVTGKPKPGAISYRPNGSGDDKAPAYFALNHAVPHRHLFSQCEYIVTHGGAGTMQAALLAGVPSSAIACGPTTDQPFWADVIRDLKLGPGAFAIGKLNAARFAALLNAALMQSVASDAYRANAKAMAEKLRNEHGTENFRQIIMKRLSEVLAVSTSVNDAVANAM